MRPSPLIIALALAAGLVGCSWHPTAPSDLDQHVTIADCRFQINRASFFRDFMPVVGPSRGPDGGRPLTGVVELTLENEGRSNRFSATTSVYDEDDRRYAIAAVPHDADAERREQRTVVWDGLIDHGDVRHIEVRLSEGPYLAVGSRVFVVLDWTAEHGGRGALRTQRTEITGTY
jgi:hypothetical protein